jgi:hypothetical protein
MKWIETLFGRKGTAIVPQTTAPFSLRSLAGVNSALADQFLWAANTMPSNAPRWLHWGCGAHVLEGFLNVDFLPRDPRVLSWQFLDPWPLDSLDGYFEGAFSEDTLEHFFLAEQAYLLCNLNCVLKHGGTARILMPSYARLVEHAQTREIQPGAFLHDTFGVTTPVDAINCGMRFSGHRWLHDHESFARLARDCGFEAIPTTCAHSAVAMLSGHNLRSETDSASFAHDLTKRRALRSIRVLPTAVIGAEQVEDAAPGVALYRATLNDALVKYTLPRAIAAGEIACLNIRGANVSSFRNHYYKQLAFASGDKRGIWRFDETMKSCPVMNTVTHAQIAIAMRDMPQVEELAFTPAGAGGEYFTLGPLEMFHFDSREESR